MRRRKVNEVEDLKLSRYSRKMIGPGVAEPPAIACCHRVMVYAVRSVWYWML